MLELNFNKENVVTKHFERASTGGRRGQDWKGIKFRAILSDRGRKKAEEEGVDFEPSRRSQFTIADSTFQ